MFTESVWNWFEPFINDIQDIGSLKKKSFKVLIHGHKENILHTGITSGLAIITIMYSSLHTICKCLVKRKAC